MYESVIKPDPSTMYLKKVQENDDYEVDMQYKDVGSNQNVTFSKKTHWKRRQSKCLFVVQQKKIPF